MLLVNAFDLLESTIILPIVLAIIYRKYFAGGFCCNDFKLNGQTIIITGSNSGIGKETAKELARRGARVIMACRNLSKAEKAADEIRSDLPSADISVEQMDLESYESVRDFAVRIKKTYSEIHCLINNGAVLLNPTARTQHGEEIHMGINYLGHFLLTKEILPLLTKGHPARIINLSSVFQRFGKIPFDDFHYSSKSYNKVVAYANSKLAMVLHSRHLATILKGTNVQVFSVHPGVVESSVGRNLPFGMSFLNLKVLSYFSKSSFEGAQTTIHCATEAVQHPYFYFSDCQPCFPGLRAMNDGNAKKLWELSEKLVAK